MNDLISRQAAIEALTDDYHGMISDESMKIYQIINWLSELPSAQPEQRWIPCSERLPSKADHTDDMVLVCYRNGSVRFNTYMNGWAQGNPVAWMPLPEPYRGERTEE